MSVVAGVDFGTQSVRVSLVDRARGMIGTGVAEFPVNRRAGDPDFATQSHDAHMDALAIATQRALQAADVRGEHVRAIAIDTTGSTVIPVGENLQPLDDYYLWCDHRAKDEAALITRIAHEHHLPAIDWCGGVYSSEWGFSKLLHWLRHNPDKRSQFVSAFEHCDMVAATLCGITNANDVSRSICAMGHKWLWHPTYGGLPPEEFLVAVDPLFAGVREKLNGNYRTSDHIAGQLSEHWAARLGLSAGIPIPVGAFDAHWDAIGAGVAEGDVVNVIGTSTCIVAVASEAQNVPGVCGVVRGSVYPELLGIEAGLSAVGDIFEAIARRARTTTHELSAGITNYRAGQTGLLRLSWDNGDRTVLVNPHLGGVTLGWNLQHSAEDELFAAIEGTAFHTRIILDRMRDFGVPIARVVHTGGIPQKNDVLNQVYANVLGVPVLVPAASITGLGSAIFAFMAAGEFASIGDAQKQLCPPYRTVEPNAKAHRVYEELYAMYRELYFGLGSENAKAVEIGRVLPALKRISASVVTNSQTSIS